MIFFLDVQTALQWVYVVSEFAPYSTILIIFTIIVIVISIITIMIITIIDTIYPIITANIIVINMIININDDENFIFSNQMLSFLGVQSPLSTFTFMSISNLLSVLAAFRICT